MQTDQIRLHIDGRWSLEELSDASKSYIQLYGFAYSLLPDLPTARREDMDYIYGKFPWRGGYSTVNFFNNLFHKIPPKLRPEIRRMQYASPGYIELFELLAVAGVISRIVKTVCNAINSAHDTYRRIQKATIDHKLSKIDLTNKELDLTERQIEFCRDSSEKLISLMGITEEENRLIEQRVQGNPVMKLKMLLSVFRRVEPLATKQAEGKLTVTGAPEE